MRLLEVQFELGEPSRCSRDKQMRLEITKVARCTPARISGNWGGIEQPNARPSYFAIRQARQNATVNRTIALPIAFSPLANKPSLLRSHRAEATTTIYGGGSTIAAARVSREKKKDEEDLLQRSDGEGRTSSFGDASVLDSLLR